MRLLGAVVGYAIATAAGAACTRPVAQVQTDLGETTMVAATLRAGAALEFQVGTTWVSYEEASDILLTIELMRAGAVVSKVECRGYSFSNRSRSGCGTGHTTTSRDCDATVPAGGADGLRVSSRTNAGRASVIGLTVSVLER